MIRGIEKRYSGHHSSSSQTRQSSRGNTSWKSTSKTTTIGGKKVVTPGLAGAVGDVGMQGMTNEEMVMEEVFIKATNRAIEKALNLALFFQNAKEGYHVSVRTGTVRTVDDVVVKKSRPKKKMEKGKGDGEGEGEEGMELDVEMNGGESGQAGKETMEKEGDGQGDLEVPETQVRRLSYVQVGVRLQRT